MGRALAFLFLGLVPSALVASACGSSGNDNRPQSSDDSGAGGPDGSGSSSGSASSSSSGSSGSSSGGKAGDAGDGSVADGPIAVNTPIKHVVVIVKENHTFDNYFGTFPGAEGATTCQTAMGTVTAPHAPNSTPRDMCHEHACALDDWDHGKMDG